MKVEKAEKKANSFGNICEDKKTGGRKVDQSEKEYWNKAKAGK